MAETKATEGPKIYAAMAGIMRDTVAIAKDSKNVQQGYSFRGIDDVYNTMHPILAKHGVFCTAEIFGTPIREDRDSRSGGKLLYSIIDYKISFVAEDGSSVYSIVRGEGQDSGDKSSNKSLSAAMKYATLVMFLIPTEDMADADKDSPEVGSKPATPAEPNKRELFVMASPAQIKFLMKLTKAHDETDLLTKAEVFFGEKIGALDLMPMGKATTWINKLKGA